MMTQHETKSQVLFRGGFARNDVNRYGDILTDANADNGGGFANPTGAGLTTSAITGNDENGNQDGWYFGAAIEHQLTPDLFGFWDDTSLWGEIMFEYKEFDQEDLRRAPLGTAANDSAEGVFAIGNTPLSVVCNGVGVNGTLTANGARSLRKL